MTAAEHHERSLRVRAETLLAASDPALSISTDARELIHELLLHQIELHVQNEQLREMQIEVESSRARYRELYELAPVAFLSLDADAQIVEANKAAGVLTGTRPEALIGQRLTKLIASEQVYSFESHRRAVLSSDGRCSCALDLVLADGERREVRMESLRSGDGADVHWRTALIDMTEVQRLQRRAQHTRRLEAIGTIATGIAQDVDGMLASTLGWAELALAPLAADSPTRAAVEQLARGVTLGRKAVAQLLTLARTSERPPPPLVLDDALRRLAPRLRAVLGDAVALELDLGAPGGAACIEAEQLEQILFNLASRARHQPAAGPMRIATCALTVDALGGDVRADLDPGPCLRLDVSQAGNGGRAPAPACGSEPRAGVVGDAGWSGLGLSLAYGVARVSGGHCELLEGPGAGAASIRLYWPQASLAQHAISGTHRIAPAVVVVEDDRLVRVAIRHYLEQGGYRVIEFDRGEPALELLRAGREPIHALLSDVVLPGLRGPEIVAAARQLCPELHVLLISAHARPLLIERGWLQPGVGLLQKPFTSEELLAALRAHATRAIATAG